MEFKVQKLISYKVDNLCHKWVFTKYSNLLSKKDKRIRKALLTHYIERHTYMQEKREHVNHENLRLLRMKKCKCILGCDASCQTCDKFPMIFAIATDSEKQQTPEGNNLINF